MLAFLFTLLTHSVTHAALEPNTEYMDYDFNGLEKIRVINPSGRITVTPMPVNRVTVTVHKKNFTDNCAVGIHRPTVFEIVTEVTRGGSSDKCEADIEIQAPKNVALDITSGSGDVSVSGMEGNLQSKVDSGSLTADGKFKKVDVKSGSGDVDIKGLGSDSSIDVGSGHVNLSLLEEIESGGVNVKTGSGDATLKIPKGSKIKAALDSGSGKVSNEFTDHYNAELAVKMKTGSGNLSVKSY